MQGSPRLAGELFRRQAAANQFNSAEIGMAQYANRPVQSLYKVPEPGVALRREMMTKKGETKPVYFTDLDRVPMGDWDFPDDIHVKSSINIEHMGDVYDRLNRTVQDKPDSRYRVYLTPGGVRAFDLANDFTPQQYKELGFFDSLKVDPNYERFALDRRLPIIQRPFLSNETFASRVSGKPSRPEDFVAFPIDVIGQGLPNPENVRLISTYHDAPISKAIAREGVAPLPDSGKELLVTQLATLDPRDARRIQDRLAALKIL